MFLELARTTRAETELRPTGDLTAAVPELLLYYIPELETLHVSGPLAESAQDMWSIPARRADSTRAGTSAASHQATTIATDEESEEADDQAIADAVTEMEVTLAAAFRVRHHMKEHARQTDGHMINILHELIHHRLTRTDQDTLTAIADLVQFAKQQRIAADALRDMISNTDFHPRSA